MNSLPVIVRELRSEARHSLNHWLRVMGAGVMLATAVIVVVELRGNIAGQGHVMFGVLQPTLFSLIWLLAPIMTCDSISRERREGTLGLLFLTPLRPMDVGVAKAMSGILRAFTLILAILPVVAFPMLLGGVSGRDFLRAAMMDLLALIGGITAGLMATGRCREFSRAALLGVLLSGSLLTLLGSVQSGYFLMQVNRGAWGGPPMGEPWWFIPLILIAGPWVFCSGVADGWQRAPWATSPLMLQLSAWQLVAAVVLLLLTLLALNRSLRRFAVETGMSKRQQWWWKTFCTPALLTRTFKRVQRGRLNRNPIGWLQRRTWTARLSSWGWLAVLVAVEAFLVSGAAWGDLMNAQPFFAAFLGLGVAFSAADSFRKERETGALELLLVTPLTVRQVIWGRLFGLWGQYALVTALLLGTWWYTSSWQVRHDAGELAIIRKGFALILVSSFVFVPLIGLNQSLHRRSFFTAWLATVALGFAIPILGPWLFFSLIGGDIWWRYWEQDFVRFSGITVVLQSLLAIAASWKAFRNLNGRRFALGK